MSIIIEGGGLRQGGPSFSLRNRMLRLAWIVCWAVMAAWTPRQLHAWRRLLLNMFGAKLAPGADVRGSATVWYPPNLRMAAGAIIGPGVNCYNQAMISLGENALVSQGAHLCAGSHDVDDPGFQLFARPISIGADAWIAAEAFVGPGADIGPRAVLGARGVAFGRLEADTIYAGNPARPIRKRRLRESRAAGASGDPGVA